MGRTRKTVTEQYVATGDELAELAEDRNELADANEGVTIFDLSAADEKRIDRVHVFRKDPPEGFLGEVAPGITEAEILSRWGGSEYRLEGKNTKGQVVKVRSITLAGDPTFVSEIFEARWRRQNGLRPRGDAPATAPAEQLSIKDVLLMLDSREATRRTEERERQEQNRRDESEREERRARDQEEREERRRKDEAEREERARKARTEDEERRRQQHREDIERQQQQAAMLLTQQAQMFQATISMLKTEHEGAVKTDPIEMLTKGVALAVQLRGEGGDGGPGDPMTAIASRLPEILQGVTQVGGAVMNEIRGRKADKAGKPGGVAPVTIAGPMAAKMRAVGAEMVKRGLDPTAEFDRLLTGLLPRKKAIPAKVVPEVKAKAKAKPKSKPARKPAPPKSAPPLRPTVIATRPAAAVAP